MTDLSTFVRRMMCIYVVRRLDVCVGVLFHVLCLANLILCLCKEMRKTVGCGYRKITRLEVDLLAYIWEVVCRFQSLLNSSIIALFDFQHRA